MSTYYKSLSKYGRIPKNYRPNAKGQHGSQQKLEERQQHLFMELHKQHIEFQQFTQQKTELQQKLLEKLRVNSLNGSKTLKKTRYFLRVQSV